jgi:predicted phosphodiesterase
MKTILVCTDSHGDEADDRTIDAVLRRKRDLKPDIIVHMGDLWDFKSIRRGASPEEKACSMIDDFDAGLEFAQELFKGKQKNYFLWGNHDWRLFDVADGADGPRADAAQMIIDKIKYHFKRLNVKTTPFDAQKGVLRIGDVAFIHGYCHAMNAAKKHAEVYGGTAKLVMAGDLHTDLYWRSASIDPVQCQHVPCMTRLDHEYARRHINKMKHCQGWAEIYIDGKELRYQVIRKNEKNRFQAFTEICEY